MKAIIGAIHRRSVTRIGVRIGTMAHQESIPCSGSSADEAVVRGWIRGLQIVREQGASEAVIVVNRRVLEGHLHLGWEVRSLSLLEAWRQFAQSTKDISLTFTYRTRQPHSNTSPGRCRWSARPK